jgi:hypothetical protein
MMALSMMMDGVLGWKRIQSVYNTNKYLDVQSNGHGVNFQGKRNNDKQKWNIGSFSGNYELINQGGNSLDCVCCDGAFVNDCSWPSNNCWCEAERAKYLSGYDTQVNVYEQTKDGEEEWDLILVGTDQYRMKCVGKGSDGYLYITTSYDAKRGSERTDGLDLFYILDSDNNRQTSYSAVAVFGDLIDDAFYYNDGNNNGGNGEYSDGVDVDGDFFYVYVYDILVNGAQWTVYLLAVVVVSVCTTILTIKCCYHGQQQQRRNNKVYTPVINVANEHDVDDTTMTADITTNV